ncbi:hypothetical protein [Rhizobium sp. L1K21]|uniref:hypothetical protein n=1 Tax=Rhizobium sp. L1K21 TaxID=2954933 RepID=UPI00209351A1|nr:hypothetical protein [Rhizobium sp. L1K21]MCO6184904.1 hypothetical protein [Rhizobium sp. L1K21]
MELALPQWPATLGAQVAQVSALVTLVLGLIFLATARPLAARWGFDERDGRTGAVGELRVAGGFMAGLGIAAYLFDQPFIYVILGSALGFAAFGRLLSMMSASDGPSGFINFLLFLLQAALSAAALTWLFDVWTAESSFAMPDDQAGMIVFTANVLTAAVGFVVLFAPWIAMMVSGLAAQEGKTRVLAAVRSTGGFLMGAGIVALLISNPLAELAMGTAYLFSLAGRIVAAVFDRGRPYFNGTAAIFQALLCAIYLGHVFGYF